MLAIAPRCSSRTAASLLILALLSLLPLSLQAASRPVHVLATTYPVWQLARPLVAGLENIRLDLLIPAATGCPHDYAPTPADLTKVAALDWRQLSPRPWPRPKPAKPTAAKASPCLLAAPTMRKKGTIIITMTTRMSSLPLLLRPRWPGPWPRP